MKVYQDNFLQGLVVDSFAGGGGASTGIEFALGRPVDIAINHDPAAIEMHRENHPYTRHYCESVWDIDPVQVCAGRSVDILWASPDCKHFSKAKGGKPVDKKIRGLAWVVLRWAAKVRPRIIFLENVEEFQTWCPVRHGKPVPSKKGETFRKFVGQLEDLGYVVDWRELRACDYGAPTSRKRLYLIARCDGKPIIFPEPTHGPGKKPYKSAADVIDWTVPCPSIFEREKPLVPATLRRITKGLDRYVIKAKKPFIMDTTLSPFVEQANFENIPLDTREPLSTVTGINKHRLVAPKIQPFISKYYGGTYRGAGSDASAPLDTITTEERHALVIPFLSSFYKGGGSAQADGVDKPLHTILTKEKHAVVTVRLTAADREANSLGHWEQVRQILNGYAGYDLKDDEILLSNVNGEVFFISDIGMRMLLSKELYAAQGFPSDYKFEFDWNGKPYSKKAQVARCGNSVCPQMAEMLVRANVKELTYKTTINSMKQLEELIA